MNKNNNTWNNDQCNNKTYLMQKIYQISHNL